jgi:hypothetical protein
VVSESEKRERERLQARRYFIEGRNQVRRLGEEGYGFRNGEGMGRFRRGYGGDDDEDESYDEEEDDEEEDEEDEEEDEEDEEAERDDYYEDG